MSHGSQRTVKTVRRIEAAGRIACARGDYSRGVEALLAGRKCDTGSIKRALNGIYSRLPL
ncbi:MAG: hypothetical protein HQK89_17005 [Nitrospirae bacterium]|nr:hypothetical protein [Nitrospirota bacterium]